MAIPVYANCIPIVIIAVLAVVVSTKVIFAIAAKTDYRKNDFLNVMLIQVGVIAVLGLLSPVLSDVFDAGRYGVTVYYYMTLGVIDLIVLTLLLRRLIKIEWGRSFLAALVTVLIYSVSALLLDYILTYISIHFFQPEPPIGPHA